MINNLKILCSASSVSGRENKIREAISKIISPYCDELKTDAMGNLICVRYSRKENAKRLMICAHMDEIGFMVNYIDDKGFLSVSRVGGINSCSAAYTEVVSERGVRGVCSPVSGTKSEDLDVSKLRIDIGAKNKQEAERKVRLGDFFVVRPTITRLMNNRYCGRPIDNRLGCAALIEAARNIRSITPACDVYFVFSVQEEVGCRGSMPAAYAIRPNWSIAIDITTSGDTPGSVGRVCDLGGGAAIKIMDASAICSREIVDMLVSVAKKEKIPYQCELKSNGGTDTGSMQRTGAGSLAGAITIPIRYTHTNFELFDLNDAKACVALITKFIESLE